MRKIMTNATYRVLGFPLACRTSILIEQLLLEYQSNYEDSLEFNIESISRLALLVDKANPKSILKTKDISVFVQQDRVSISFENAILNVLNVIFNPSDDLWNRFPLGHRKPPILNTTISRKLVTQQMSISAATSWEIFVHAIIDLIAIMKLLINSNLIGSELVSIRTGLKILNRQELHCRRIEILYELGMHLSEFMEELKELTEIKDRCYIPTLRTLHAVLEKEDERILSDFLKTTAKANYKDEISQDVNIFTGQSLFKEILKARTGTKDKRDKLDKFESFLSENFFHEKSIELIAALHIIDREHTKELIDGGYKEINDFQQKEGDILIKIGDNPDQPIHKLGDGIQALIMLTFPIFMAEPDTLIFIEEPELNLHPGMQRVFLDVITNHPKIVEKNLAFFMTTHSNHFLDLTITENAPVSIFTLRESKVNEDGKPRFEIRNVHSGEKGILELLGVQNSSVFVGNCSIWVEGHTDRKYIRKYLQELIKFKKFPNVSEDLHYVFFEYSGANLAHYRAGEAESDQEKHSTIDLLRLNNAVMVVGDKDQFVKDYLRRFQEFDKIGFKYLLPESGKEIENLLSPIVLSKILPYLDGFKQKLKGKESEISKLNHDEYRESKLRDFIEGRFNPNWDKESKAFTSEQKRDLCELAMKELTWGNMSVEARKLALAVYNFIASENWMKTQVLDPENDFIEPEVSIQQQSKDNLN